MSQLVQMCRLVLEGRICRTVAGRWYLLRFGELADEPRAWWEQIHMKGTRIDRPAQRYEDNRSNKERT